MLHQLALFSTFLVKTLVETYNKKTKKYYNSGDKKRKQARAGAITGNAILQPIQDAVNNEISEKNDKNISDYGASNSNSDFKQPKFISFSFLIKEVILNNLRDKRRYWR